MLDQRSCVLGGYRVRRPQFQSVANFVMGSPKQRTLPAGQGDNTGRVCVESSSDALQMGYYISNNIQAGAKDVYSNKGARRGATAGQLL